MSETKESYLARMLGEAQGEREEGRAAGLRNLGATCYVSHSLLTAVCSYSSQANAFLQVWFRNIQFRNGVYAAVQSSVSRVPIVLGLSLQSCNPLTPQTTKSPLYHLAMIFASLQYSGRAVVDPSPLIESLGLKKNDQQDAAE
jgi:ubiquitin carboxyl-terminal hydrolase 48